MKLQFTKKRMTQISTADFVFIWKGFQILNFTCKDYIYMTARLAKLAFLTAMCILIQFLVVKFSMTNLKWFFTKTLIKYGTKNTLISIFYLEKTYIFKIRNHSLTNHCRCPKIKSLPKTFFFKLSTFIRDIRIQWFLVYNSLEVY